MMQSPSTPSPVLPSGGAALRGGFVAWVGTHMDRVLAVAVVAALAVKFLLIARINVNWDEFYFLELVHQYAQGTLPGRFQTFHVHLFSWLPQLGWTQINQIIAGRAVMQILAMASAYLIYAVARRFVTRRGALFALLAYLSVGAVIEHGASFRVDPIVTYLSLLSLFAILCRPAGLLGAAFAGIAMALAMLLTIKSAFYLVVIAGVFWCMAATMRSRIKLALAFAIPFSLGIAALFLVHSATLAPQETTGAGAFLRGSASKVLLESLFPRAFDFIEVVISNPLVWLMLAEGALIAWAAARKPESRSGWSALLPLVLALPVLTPILYRNAFPYFFPVILAPAAILVGLSFDKHQRAAPKPSALQPARLAAILVAVQCAILLIGTLSRLGDDVQVQRQTIAQVRAIFPEPVPYIEGFGVLAGYPRSGFFQSSWGVDNYRQAGRPIFADLVAKDQPPLLFADSPSLYGALVPGILVNQDRALLPEDARFLQDNYVRHWGMVFVAGKHLSSSSHKSLSFGVAVTGEYRIEAAIPVMIDGNRLEPGSVVPLAAGDHTIDFGEGAEATLRWAQASHAPEPAPTDPLTFFDRKTWAGMTPQMMRPDDPTSGNLQP